MIIIKVYVQRFIISVISVYAPQYGLDNCQEDDFYDSFIDVVRTWGEKEIVVIVGYFNGHVGSNPEN